MRTWQTGTDKVSAISSILNHVVTNYDLEMETYIVHIKSWHPKTFDPNSICTFPVVVDVIKHIVRYTTFPWEHETS